MAKQVEELETERLILRGIREDDAPEIVKWRSDPEVYRYFKNPHRITIEEHMHWYHDRYLLDENRIDWMCIEKATGNKAGVFGLVLDEEKTEINYLLAPQVQHKGYAREIIGFLFFYSHILFDTNTVIAEIHKKNYPSIALVENLGFVLTGAKDDFLIYSKEVL